MTEVKVEQAQPRLLRAEIILPFLIVSAIWGSTWLVIRDQISTVPPGWSIAYRFLVAGAAMALLALVRRVPLWIGAQGIGFATCLGIAQFCLNFGFVYRAEASVTSGLVAVIYALLLVPNSILSWFVFRQPVTRGFIAGSVLAMAGIALLFLHEYRVAPLGDAGQVLGGLAMALGGVLSASTANVMQGTRIARSLPMIAVLAWAMLIGGGIDAAVAWATTGPPAFDPRPGYAAGVLYLALAGSVVTFPLYFRLIQQMGAGRAAYTSVLIPVVAMLLSTLFEGYVWSPLAIAGAVVVMAGMVVALRSR